MDNKIECQVHDLALEAIVQGRLLAEEWFECGLVPVGAAKSAILDALRCLQDRGGAQSFEISTLDLMRSQIRKALNDLRAGKGDAAMTSDIDLTWEQDPKVIDYVNLAYRCRKFLEARVRLDDKLAAIRCTDNLLFDRL